MAVILVEFDKLKINNEAYIQSIANFNTKNVKLKIKDI